MKHLFKVIIFLLIALSSFVYGQEATPQYNLKVKLIEAKKRLKFHKQFNFKIILKPLYKHYTLMTGLMPTAHQSRPLHSDLQKSMTGDFILDQKPKEEKLGI